MPKQINITLCGVSRITKPFFDIEVRPCKDDGESTFNVPESDAEFWTVYVRYNDGCLEAVMDCTTKIEANDMRRLLLTLIDKFDRTKR